jgi:hypothetical protein
MPRTETRWQGTEQVLGFVTRARTSLATINQANVNASGVFQHPATQLAALRAARDHLDKAIEIMQRLYGPGVKLGASAPPPE